MEGTIADAFDEAQKEMVFQIAEAHRKGYRDGYKKGIRDAIAMLDGLKKDKENAT